MIVFHRVEKFTAFPAPGDVKVAISFFLEPHCKGAITNMARRILAADEVATQRFRGTRRYVEPAVGLSGTGCSGKVHSSVIGRHISFQ